VEDAVEQYRRDRDPRELLWLTLAIFPILQEKC
jgi:hypothetical protein